MRISRTTPGGVTYSARFTSKPTPEALAALDAVAEAAAAWLPHEQPATTYAAISGGGTTCPDGYPHIDAFGSGRSATYGRCWRCNALLQPATGARRPPAPGDHEHTGTAPDEGDAPRHQDQAGTSPGAE